ncbi:MAG: PT domain-containing protein [Lachnospiraceae bacterium]|nr:PT domain-containing protein [Lachnospiraceae bacterium]
MVKRTKSARPSAKPFAKPSACPSARPSARPSASPSAWPSSLAFLRSAGRSTSSKYSNNTAMSRSFT